MIVYAYGYLKTREERNTFMDETAGMKKESSRALSDHYTFLVTN